MNEEEKKKLNDEIEELKATIDRLKLDYDHHTHDGVNTQQVSSSGGATGGTSFYIPMTLAYTLPQTANNFYGIQWIAPVACTVVSIHEMHKDSAAGALTLDVRKGATTLLATPFDLLGVGGDVDTTGTLTGTAADLAFAVGDSLQWGVSGSVGAIQGVCVTVEFSPN